MVFDEDSNYFPENVNLDLTEDIASQSDSL